MNTLEERIGYAFQKPELLTLALTHPSMQGAVSNQRLEFLGDAILGAVIARLLYDLYPDEKEGELARRRASLVKGETLAKVARDIGLGEELRVGSSEKCGRDKSSNLEDALEALIGALYLDGGMEAAERFIAPRWQAMAQTSQSAGKDAKTALQEWAQARSLPVPVYRVAQQSGPSHAPEFTIEVTLPGQAPAEAKAASKRLAEQEAAAALLARLQDKTA